VTGADLTRLLVEALYLVLLVSGPPLLVSLVVGLLVGLGQAMTQVQEQTLTFVPKLVAVGLVLGVLGGWMGAEVLRFTGALWMEIPALVQTP
jgi:flagellar biosynthetic protein FliQ